VVTNNEQMSKNILLYLYFPSVWIVKYNYNLIIYNLEITVSEWTKMETLVILIMALKPL